MDDRSSPGSTVGIKMTGSRDPEVVQKTDEEPIRTLVDFDGQDDPYNPVNWPLFKKTYTSLLYGLTSLGSVWASTAYAPANSSIVAEFQVSSEVAIIGTSLLLLGWAFGPLLWAPLSEVYGRKWPVLLPFLVSVAMSFGSAAAKDIQTLLITRFFTGFFGSAPITCTGGVYVDLWEPTQRGVAIVGYTFCVCGGPSLGPVVGGAIIYSGINWRWTLYITAILEATVFLFDILFITESYPPVLLSRRARALREKTGNPTLYSGRDNADILLSDLAIKYGLRPLQMLTTPICLFVTIYTAFIYAVFYASLASFPIIFAETRKWDQLVSNLPYLAVLVGITLGAGVNLLNQRYYNERFLANDRKPVPEARLPPMMLASVILAAGLFVIGWTSVPGAGGGGGLAPWPATLVGVLMMGFGYYTIFTSALNYLIDTFQRWGASALAANTFARSVLAAVLPLLVPAMYRRLGNGWAYSVLGVFAVCNVPVPFVFYYFGEKIRRRGRWSNNLG